MEDPAGSGSYRDELLQGGTERGWQNIRIPDALPASFKRYKYEVCIYKTFLGGWGPAWGKRFLLGDPAAVAR